MSHRRRARFHARLDARSGEQERVAAEFTEAERAFADHGLVFRRAVVRLEHAEWLIEQDHADGAERLLEQAGETFEHLAARPWLERVEAARARTPAELPA